MFKLREIKNKIFLTQNIYQITKAISLVSAFKMKKAQALALNSRPFTQGALEILKELTKFQKEMEESIYFQKGKGEKILAVVVASDKGFCGPFNKNILNFSQKEIEKFKDKVEIFAIGKKTANFFQQRNFKVLVKFFGIGDYGELEEVEPIAEKLIDYFKEGRFERIFLFYTDFISSFSQKPTKIQLLPLDLEKIEEMLRNYQLKEKGEKVIKEEIEEKKNYSLLLEPSTKEVFERLVSQLIRYVIYHSILEANASEHSARMLAMERASQNAKEKEAELLLEFNKARQNKITSEISEITTAKEALS